MKTEIYELSSKEIPCVAGGAQGAGGAILGTIGSTTGGTHACCSGQLNGFQNLLGVLKPA
jgi:hypothetical protein